MSTQTKTQETAPADPVAAAERQLAEAQRRHDAAQAKLETYKRQILDGGNVSPEDYADAGHRAEHAALELEAAQLAHAAAQETARQARLAEIAEHVESISDPAAMLDALSDLAAAAARVIGLCDDRNAAVRRATADMRGEGVPKLDPLGKARFQPDGTVDHPYTAVTDEHHRLGWTTGGFGGTPDTVTVGGHQVRVLSPGELIAMALYDALRSTGKAASALAPEVQVTPHRAYTENPAGYLTRIL